MALEGVPALHSAFAKLLFTADDVDIAALSAFEDWQRQTPVALLGDHPVVHVREPIELAVQAEAWIPLRRPGSVHHRLPEVIHGDVPLVDQSEDEVRAAAPANRITVPV